MNIVDWLLVPAIVVFAYSGWRQGFAAGLISFLGFLLGGLIGARVVPTLLDGTDISGVWRVLITSAVVLAAASLGNTVAATVGRRVCERITWEPGRAADSAGGAAFNVAALAVFAWVVASTVAVLPASDVTTAVRQSTFLGHLDAAVPDGARAWFDDLRAWLDTSGLPRVFAGISGGPAAVVDPPDPALLKVPAVKAAWNSLVKVEGDAPSCRSSVTGSGFVVGPDLVMTNAHVVAGVPDPEVLLRGTGPVYPATTVYWDPQTDIAVLRVPGLGATPLAFEGNATRGDPAVIAGFPGGGPLSAVPARVRGEITARGTDIYGRGTVLREVYALRGTVRSGNSGGPLLTPTGDVYGVVFAASLDDPDTGYALTSELVTPALTAAKTLSAEVSTGPCTKG